MLRLQEEGSLPFCVVRPLISFSAMKNVGRRNETLLLLSLWLSVSCISCGILYTVKCTELYCFSDFIFRVAARAMLFEKASSQQSAPVGRCCTRVWPRKSSNLPFQNWFLLSLQRCQGDVFLRGRAQPRAQLPTGGALLKRWAEPDK